VERALWARVQRQLKLDTRRGVRHGKVDALLSGLLYCAQCGESYGSRAALIPFGEVPQLRRSSRPLLGDTCACVCPVVAKRRPARPSTVDCGL
jgi:hypothetical protein